MDALEMGPLYEQVGYLIVDDLRENPDGAFMYAEVGESYVDCSIFKDIGDRVIYRRCGIALTEKLYEIWEEIEPSKRWLTMSYTITDGKFHTIFGFPEEVDQNEFYTDRRPRVVAAKFGSKEVDYSDP